MVLENISGIMKVVENVSTFMIFSIFGIFGLLIADVWGDLVKRIARKILETSNSNSTIDAKAFKRKMVQLIITTGLLTGLAGDFAVKHISTKLGFSTMIMLAMAVAVSMMGLLFFAFHRGTALEGRYKRKAISKLFLTILNKVAFRGIISDDVITAASNVDFASELFEDGDSKLNKRHNKRKKYAIKTHTTPPVVPKKVKTFPIAGDQFCDICTSDKRYDCNNCDVYNLDEVQVDESSDYVEHGDASIILKNENEFDFYGPTGIE